MRENEEGADEGLDAWDSVWLDDVMEAIETIRDLAGRQHGLVSTRQLTTIGIAKAVWQRRVENGDLVRVTRQVLRFDGVPDTAEQPAMIAVLDAPDGAALSHTAAAALWGLPGFRLDRDLHVVVPARGTPKRRRTATLHYQIDRPSDHVLWYRGVPVTSPTLTMFHLAAICHPERVARALDRAWSEGLLSGTSVSALLDRIAARGRNGIATIRELLEQRGAGYVPPASNLEHRFASLFSENSGIPPLRRQVDIGGNYWVGRVDFVWGDLPGGVEVQSERYHTSLVDRESDRKRIEVLERSGLSMLEVWDTDIYHRPQHVVDRVRRFRWWLEGLIDTRPE